MSLLFKTYVEIKIEIEGRLHCGVEIGACLFYNGALRETDEDILVFLADLTHFRQKIENHDSSSVAHINSWLLIEGSLNPITIGFFLNISKTAYIKTLNG